MGVSFFTCLSEHDGSSFISLISKETRARLHLHKEPQPTPGTATEMNPSLTNECSSFLSFFISLHVLRPVKCNTQQIKHQQEEKQGEQDAHILMKHKENVFFHSATTFFHCAL